MSDEDHRALLDSAVSDVGVDRTLRRLSREHPTAEVRFLAGVMSGQLEILAGSLDPYGPDRDRPDRTRTPGEHRAAVARTLARNAGELILLLHAPPRRSWRRRLGQPWSPKG